MSAGRPVGVPGGDLGAAGDTREELARAFADYQAGRLGVIPAARRV